MNVTDQLLRNNERYAGSFEKGAQPLPPAKRVAIVACMDERSGSTSTGSGGSTTATPT
jgi:carbonic anhydrase